jgi:stage V sporulation protein R
LNLTGDLKVLQEEIRGHALDYGLDFFEVVFEILDYSQINEVAAYDGFPTRYPHWRFGMAYEQITKGYAYGLQKIYELVINNDPCYAYLLRANNLVDQKMVMAHVYGHSDFFKNNYWFSRTDRKMMDEIANHGTRIHRYAERFGQERVETFLDACLSLETLIDPHAPFIARRPRPVPEDDDGEGRGPRKLQAKQYMDTFVNPPAVLEAERQRMAEERQARRKFPAEPTREVLAFLVQHAPMEKWQRDILTMVREEAYYFAPQGMTKIMNEGWASYWHSRIMTEKMVTDAEVLDYADHHSGTMGSRPGVLNPYKIGIELYRSIEDRWNKGKFGKEYEECTDMARKRSWDRKLNRGREKIFEVRKIHNDVTFIDEFLTEEFCEDQKLFTYAFDRNTGKYVIADRDYRKVKEKLLLSIANRGLPYIYVTDGNHENRGELYLSHRHEGQDLRLDHARDCLQNLARIWTRPVHLETIIQGRAKILSHDGEKHSERLVG